MLEDEPVNEYRIKVTVRNNLILNAIESAGYKSVAAFCVAAGLHKTALTELIAMRKPPLNNDGEFSLIAKKLMEELCLLPTELWTSEQLTLKLNRNSAERDVSSAGMRAALGVHAEEMLELMKPAAPDESILKQEMVGIVEEQLGTLSPRAARMLRMRFGIGCDEHTLEEAGKVLDVTRERARQIEAKALRYIKHPSRADKLRQLLPNYERRVEAEHPSDEWRTCKHEFMQGLTEDKRLLKCPYCGTTDVYFYHMLHLLDSKAASQVRDTTGIHLPRNQYEHNNLHQE